jgi:hypothetical protein
LEPPREGCGIRVTIPGMNRMGDGNGLTYEGWLITMTEDLASQNTFRIGLEGPIDRLASTL